MQCWPSLLAVRYKLEFCTVGGVSGPVATSFVVDIGLDRFSGIVRRCLSISRGQDCIGAAGG